ncbi:MAG TPA: hypothetical protein VGC27_02480 [Rhizomicrobium sp.]
MPVLGFGFLFSLLCAFLCAFHVYRTGRPYLWLLVIFLLPGGLGPLIYVAYVLLFDTTDSRSVRRFADNVANAADPGRAYREKLREVERVGSADAKRALAEECIKRGRFQDAVELYQGAMSGPLGDSDAVLLRGLARARLLAGDGQGAVEAFENLKRMDRAAFDADVELDYARALALVGRVDDALYQYETVVPRYPGEEARCRFALLLKSVGQTERARALFTEIIKSVRGAPGYYRRRQREWYRIARKQLNG